MKPASSIPYPGKRKPLLNALHAACLLLLTLPASNAAGASTPWDVPAAQLAEQIAGLLGPGQAQLDLTNRSAIPPSEIPAIRKSLEDALRSHGVRLADAASANSIHITLSENARERLWIAQIAEGNEIQVTMVRMDGQAAPAVSAEGGVVLQRNRLWLSSSETADNRGPAAPVLAALELHGELVVLMQDRVTVFAKAATGWSEKQRLPITAHVEAGHPFPRDPRGELVSMPDGSGFAAYLPGIKCSSTFNSPTTPDGSTAEGALTCNTSDDPWPLVGQSANAKAFYNAARNYFTGVITPNYGAELTPFYSAVVLPQSPFTQGAATSTPLLASLINGKLQLVTQSASRTVSGARDWGSEIAVLNTGCGSGAQVLASASGEAASDSLRAYEIHGQEAVAVSAPMPIDGSIMALDTATDLSSVLAIVRNGQNDYEVDRVTAVCP
jgi:hypothetical protein